ncbi:hypothetical protein GCM10022279_21040 [Comamonas faecalis]|uniref:Arc family DNA-binding protein n=1 Tax=Comamonas faecalis TaxID=1387849 RepID=A0ABP7RGH1_9BURK
MTTVAPEAPEQAGQEKADKYILRFENPGHRARLKAQAAIEKRTLNKQILILIEAGERALQQPRQPAQQTSAQAPAAQSAE